MIGIKADFLVLYCATHHYEIYQLLVTEIRLFITVDEAEFGLRPRDRCHIGLSVRAEKSKKIQTGTKFSWNQIHVTHCIKHTLPAEETLFLQYHQRLDTVRSTPQ